MVFLKKIQWLTLPFLSLSLILSVLGLAIYIPSYGVHPVEPIFCATFVLIVAMVISGGYHRYFAHKTFECHPILKVFYLIMGCAAFQQSALVWASDHRFHHRYVDTDKDPYNIQKGFWWAHVGWMLSKNPVSRDTLLQNVPDLAKDKWVMWQHRYWIWISIPLAFGIPLLVGLLIGRPMGMLLWGALLRIVITHHTTFTINSVAHRFGTQPYSDENSAKDVWWLAPILCGENYHNYHHAFQGDYRNGIRWYHWDPTKWALWFLSNTPLVRRLRRAPFHLVLKARLEMDLKRLKGRINPKPAEFWIPLYNRLLAMRQGLEEAAEHCARARKNYQELKTNLAKYSRESLQAARENLREKEKSFQQSLAQWRESFRQSLLLLQPRGSVNVGSS